MQIPVIFEDSEIVVLDKPSGVVCNRAETVTSETLQDWWDDKYKSSNLKFSNSQIEDEKYFLSIQPNKNN